MEYSEWKYLYPPRPESAISPDTLAYFESRGWLAQGKKNGTNGLIGISPEKEFIEMNRHEAEHKKWRLTPYLKEQLVRLFPEPKWFVLCSEYMHDKTTAIKNTIYIHDMLVWKGEFLLDSEFLDRAKILDERLITNVETKFCYICDPKSKLWYAKRFETGFKEMFWSITDPKEDEGLVLKDPHGKLRACRTPTENQHWLAKCRHPRAGYVF